MRTICAVTTGRSDYGILTPVLREIEASELLKLQLIVTGAHLSQLHGNTVQAVDADGFEIAERADMLLSDDTPRAISKSMGIGIMALADAYARVQPDWVLVAGDRFEALAAVTAALPFAIPVAHMHGGEVTEGAVDNQIRHAITKMSHLHFVATELSAERVIQMGEEPRRVVVTGAAALDSLRSTTLLPRADLEIRLGLSLNPAPVVVTYHPVTLEYESSERDATQLVRALASVDRPIVITASNADTYNSRINAVLQAFADSRANAVIVDSLGSHLYFSLLACAAVMVGNSSSGIIEGPSFLLPVVNIGARQAGRERAANVIDVPPERNAIEVGLEQALSDGFVAGLKGLRNPYGEGIAAAAIVKTLSEITMGTISRKRDWLAAP